MLVWKRDMRVLGSCQRLIVMCDSGDLPMRNFLVASVLCVLYLSPAQAQTLELTVIDVGQGDAILIEFPPGSTGNRKTMLIDGGPSLTTSNAVMQLLGSKSITTLDFVVLTHPHVDHYKGLIPVLESNTITVKEFWWSEEARGGTRDPSLSPNSPWHRVANGMNNAGEIVLVTQGMKRSSQKAKIEIFNAGGEYPDTSNGEDINNDSIVMMLSYRGVKVLLTGDIEFAEGEDLADDYSSRKLNCDVIKIPHHGSAELSQRFIEEADAEFVLISAAHNNRSHHHPRQDALDMYEHFGAAAADFHSTSGSGTENLVLTIGPNRDQFDIQPTSPQTGWTYWRDMRGHVNEDTADSCPVARLHGHYCLETR